MNPERELTLHTLWEDLCAVVLRQKTMVAAVAVAMALTVYLGLLLVGDQFEAQASLLIKLGRENTEVPLTAAKGAVFPTGVRKEEINSYVALLTSRPLIEATVKAVGVDRFRPELPRPTSTMGWVKYGLKKTYRWGRQQLDELQVMLGLKRRLSPDELAYIACSRSLRVEREKDTDVIVLRLRLPDSGLARELLEVLTQQFLARHIEVTKLDASVLQVFEEETRTYADALLALRERASELRSRLGVSAVTEQKQQLLDMLRVAELGRLDAEREQARNEAERSGLRQRRSELEELQLTTKALSPSAASTRLRQALADLGKERTVALSRYQADADPVRKIETQIAALEAALREAPQEEDGTRTLSRNPVLVYVESRLTEDDIRAEGLKATLEKTGSQIAGIKTELRRFDQAEAELQKLEVEIKVAESRFLANASRREEARTQATLDRWKVANVAILSPASSGEKPVAPNRNLIMALGLAGGVLMGIVAALLLEWQGDIIHGPGDLERVAPGLLLGSFPAATRGASRASSDGKRVPRSAPPAKSSTALPGRGRD